MAIKLIGPKDLFVSSIRANSTGYSLLFNMTGLVYRNQIFRLYSVVQPFSFLPS